MRLYGERPYWSNSAMDSVDVITRKFTILLFDFLIIVTMANAADESDALLRLKISFTNGGVLQSWLPGTNPCDNQPWEGVICSQGSVYGIRLEGLNLSGILDIDALSQLPTLRTLSFMTNSFSGPLPAINRLVPLRALYLSQNQFSGEIPGDYFTGMKYLKKLWLSFNLFSGPIPSSLDQIPLIELHLENNQFSGGIPELNQPSLSDLDMANNNLSGPIPPGLARFDVKTFEGNPGLCGEKAGMPCQEPAKVSEPPPPQPPPQGKANGGDDGKNHMNGVSAWIMITCALIFAVMIVFIIFFRYRQYKRKELSKENENIGGEMNQSGGVVAAEANGSTGGTKICDEARSSVSELVMVNYEKGAFRMQDLLTAAAEVLGTGILGSSYKAMMSNGLTVAVKRIKDMDKNDQEEFDDEMRRLGRLKHKNVLAPLAYHYRKEEKLLITEYMEKGSLLYLLHCNGGAPNIELKWAVRLKLIEGIARGLLFIHTENSETELPHGNLKSSNVLLGDDYEPLLSDYGFVSLITKAQATEALFAYTSPEALQNQPVSPRTDVYCMGIIILEILTGKFPTQYVHNGKGGTDIVEWARSAIPEGREVELFDTDIANSPASLPEMKQLLHIGVACTEPEPENRLDIREAISRIEALHYVVSQSYEEPHFMNSPSGPGESSRPMSIENISLKDD